MRVRNGAIAIACGAAAMFGCSLFVSVGDLQNGSSDGGTDDAPIANDAISPANDASIDAPNDGSIVSGYSAAVLADKPLAYFHLDETSGSTLADSSGNGHDATSTTVLLGGDGAFAGSGTSVHFNGAAFAEIPDSVSGTGTPFDFVGMSPFSLEAWVKIDFEPDGGDSELTFFSKEQYLGGSNFEGIDFFDTSVPVLQREDSTNGYTQAVASSPVPDTTSWHYLVGTYDGSEIDIFIDNLLVGTKTISSTSLVTTSVPFLLGAENTSVGNALVGSMDEVAIYTSALTLTQRTAHFNAAKQ